VGIDSASRDVFTRPGWVYLHTQKRPPFHRLYQSKPEQARTAAEAVGLPLGRFGALEVCLFFITIEGNWLSCWLRFLYGRKVVGLPRILTGAKHSSGG
jgi:hypothetical protein